VSHPSLGTAPPDRTAGIPVAAQRLRVRRLQVGARALEVALERDPSMAGRHGELGLRKLLRDTEPMIERLALALETGDRMALAAWADWVAPLYRRRRVPMDDLVHIAEGLRRGAAAVLAPDEARIGDEAIDEAIRVLRWNRRIAGDARKRNRLIAAIYKGA
jgi:hypothetical protein